MRAGSRLWLGAAILGLGFAVSPGCASAQSPDPAGTWNLETRNLVFAERATGGVRNVLLRIEASGDG